MLVGLASLHQQLRRSKVWRCHGKNAAAGVAAAVSDAAASLFEAAYGSISRSPVSQICSVAPSHASRAWSTQSVANTVWALSRLKSQGKSSLTSGGFMRAVEASIARGDWNITQSKSSKASVSNMMPCSMRFSPQEVALLMWGLSMGTEIGLSIMTAQVQADCMSRLSMAACVGMGEMRPQGMAMVAWACGRRKGWQKATRMDLDREADLDVDSDRNKVVFEIEEEEDLDPDPDLDYWDWPRASGTGSPSGVSKRPQEELFVVPSEASEKLLSATLTELLVRSAVGRDSLDGQAPGPSLRASRSTSAERRGRSFESLGPGPVAAVLHAASVRGHHCINMDDFPSSNHSNTSYVVSSNQRRCQDDIDPKSVSEEASLILPSLEHLGTTHSGIRLSLQEVSTIIKHTGPL